MFPCPRSRQIIWSHETGSAVLSRVSLLILNTHADSGAFALRFLPISRATSIYLSCLTPSGRSQVYRVTQLRTDGINCRESAGTGPVILKAVPVRGTAFASPTDYRNIIIGETKVNLVTAMEEIYN